MKSETLLRKTAVWLMALSIGLAACGYEESREDVGRVGRAVSKELGVGSHVTVKVGTKGTFVAVRLTRLPPGEAAEIKRKVADIVTRNVRTKVQRVDVTF